MIGPYHEKVRRAIMEKKKEQLICIGRFFCALRNLEIVFHSFLAFVVVVSDAEHGVRVSVLAGQRGRHVSHL